MAYTKTVWKNRQVEKPRTYTMTDNGDGTITLDRAPGEVYEAGTAMNADNMNHLEEGIEAAHNNQKNHEDAENPHKGSASLTHASRHRTDGEDPLTIEMLGAAPSGCGYGDGAPYIGAEAGQSYTDKIDALVASWPNMMAKQYATYDANQSTYAMLATIYKYSSQATLIVAHSFTGSIVTRKKESGVWGDWEWVNPPMKLGVEYRTTERHNGKPVYVKLVDCGALPNASRKWVSVADGCTVFRCNGIAFGGTDSITLPFMYDSTHMAIVYGQQSNIMISTSYDMSASYSLTYVTAWYTK